MKLGVTGAGLRGALEPTIEALAAEGITLELVQFSGFRASQQRAQQRRHPDERLSAPRVLRQRQKAPTAMIFHVLCDTFVITMNLFSKHYDSPADIPGGRQGRRAERRDELRRARRFLQDAGLLTLGDYTGTPTTADITSSVSLVEVNAGMTYQYVDDGDRRRGRQRQLRRQLRREPEHGHLAGEDVDLTDKALARDRRQKRRRGRRSYRKVAETFCSDATKQLFDEKYKGLLRPPLGTRNERTDFRRERRNTMEWLKKNPAGRRPRRHRRH